MRNMRGIQCLKGSEHRLLEGKRTSMAIKLLRYQSAKPKLFNLAQNYLKKKKLIKKKY